MRRDDRTVRYIAGRAAATGRGVDTGAAGGGRAERLQLRRVGLRGGLGPVDGASGVTSRLAPGPLPSVSEPIVSESRYRGAPLDRLSVYAHENRIPAGIYDPK